MKISDLTLEERELLVSELVDRDAFSSSYISRSSGRGVDEDGFSINNSTSSIDLDFYELQSECWRRVQDSPHLSGYINDTVGKVLGEGFSIQSFESKVQSIIDEVMYHPANDFLLNFPSYISRHLVEGELFLSLTIHSDGFCELDFIDPARIRSDGFTFSNDFEYGVYFHPNKPQLPLAYVVSSGGGDFSVVPSHYLLLMPSYIKYIPKGISSHFQKISSPRYAAINNLSTYIIQWTGSLVSRRSLSQVRSVLEWLNYYELMKKIEVDYKRSATSYLWSISFEDRSSFRLWLAMTDEERERTGLMSKKEAGGTLILPPGVRLDVKAPALTSITDEDKDLLHFVTSGLGIDSATLTGDYNNNTYASAKMARSPLLDRFAAYATFIERFLIMSIFRSIFEAKRVVGGKRLEFRVEEVVRFSNREPIVKRVLRQGWQLIDVTFPLDDASDLSEKVSALLGTKHGSVMDTLGISKATVAKKLGLGAYTKEVMRYWGEREVMPELPFDGIMSQDSVQEGIVSRSESAVETDGGSDSAVETDGGSDDK